MYRAYASDPQARINLGIRRRLAPLLGNNRRRIELMNALLFSLPGTPVIYYGDEIGMGDNIYLGDRNGVRTPMQWSADRNAGFSPGQPAEAVPAGHHRPGVPLRGDQRRGAAEQPAFAAVVDEAADRAAEAATRRSAAARSIPAAGQRARSWPSCRDYEDERILVVANLSRFVQYVELDLGDVAGRDADRAVRPHPVPAGRGRRRTCSRWARTPSTGSCSRTVRPRGARDTRSSRCPLCTSPATGRSWFGVRSGRCWRTCCRPTCRESRWFRGKARQIDLRHGGARDSGAAWTSASVLVTLVEVRYLDADPEHYVLPLGYADGRSAREIALASPGSVILSREGGGVRLRRHGRRGGSRTRWWTASGASGTGAAPGASWWEPHPRLPRASGRGRVAAHRRAARRAVQHLGQPRRPAALQVVPQGGAGAQSGSGAGPVSSPSTPISAGSPCSPGGLELRTRNAEPIDAGRAAPVRAERGRCVDLHPQRAQPLLRARPRLVDPAERGGAGPGLDSRAGQTGAAGGSGGSGGRIHDAGPPPGAAHRRIPSRRWRRPREPRVRRRSRSPCSIAARSTSRSAPAPAPRSISCAGGSPPCRSRCATRPRAVLSLEDSLLKQARAVMDRKIPMARIRIHGDYHLGQVLFTGKDFVIVDLEGEPSRSRERAALSSARRCAMWRG